MTFRLVLRTVSSLGVQELFDRSLSIDEHTASMAESAETAIAGVRQGQIGWGESVTWRARHFGVWLTMTSKITELEAPWRFVDEQQRGPFKRFRHEHRFTETAEGTLMTDALVVTAPLGPLGWLAERIFLERYLHRLIDERNRYLVRR
ncbi:MAG: SRPBCC family protein [Renibacterium sp.]|nr:SRPBCC family protein [Renibacterium sp.]